MAVDEKLIVESLDRPCMTTSIVIITTWIRWSRTTVQNTRFFFFITFNETVRNSFIITGVSMFRQLNIYLDKDGLIKFIYCLWLTIKDKTLYLDKKIDFNFNKTNVMFKNYILMVDRLKIPFCIFVCTLIPLPQFEMNYVFPRYNFGKKKKYYRDKKMEQTSGISKKKKNWIKTQDRSHRTVIMNLRGWSADSWRKEI